MSESKLPAPQADELARKLQASLAQRRPRPWKLVLGTLAGCTLVLVLLGWWFYPQRRQEALQVLALHDVFTNDETPRARAQLILPEEDEDRSRLSGQTIVFTEQRTILPQGEKPREIMATSDAHGQASVDWPVAPPAPMTEFLARYVNVSQRHASLFDRGRLYIWPKEAPLLLVDADETLIADRLDEAAGKTLRQAHEAGWRIVYLALAGAQPHDLRKARGWIENEVKLPRGPVLGRTHYADEDAVERERRIVLKSLRDRFKGSIAAVVKSADAAHACRDAGVRVIMIGAGPAPAEVLVVPGWAEVPVRLK